MGRIGSDEIIKKYQIQYKHPNSLGDGTFILDGEIYEFTWQYYDYQYIIYKSNGAGTRYAICMEPDKLEIEIFFLTLKEMIANDEHYKIID